MANPNLQHFPLEIWEFIITLLNDAKDVLALIGVYPHTRQLAIEMNGQEWLFGQILPILRKWISPKDVSNCRLVCKNWNVGVDQYLRDGFQMIYHPTVDIHTTYLTSRKDSLMNYRHQQNSLANLHIKFETHGEALEFLHQITNSPPDAIPFLGNRLELKFPEHKMFNIFSTIFRDVSNTLIYTYGHHLHFLQISSSQETFGSLIVNAMRFLPNLKVIDITWLSPLSISLTSKRWRDKQRRQTIQFKLMEAEEHLQQLQMPHIATLTSITLRPTVLTKKYQAKWDQIVLLPPYLMHHFVRTYHTQIKQVSISESEWRMEYQSLQFSNLEYLSLYYSKDINKVTQILNSISKSSSLKTLEIEIKIAQPRFTPRNTISLHQICSWIILFPQLEHFRINVDGQVTKYANDNDYSITSLKSITLKWPRIHLLGPMLLLQFPRIEAAKLNEHQKLYSFFQLWSGANNEIVTPYDWENVWNTLPKLQEINIGPLPLEYNYKLKTHYTRICYEYILNDRREMAILEELMLYFSNLLV